MTRSLSFWIYCSSYYDKHVDFIFITHSIKIYLPYSVHRQKLGKDWVAAGRCQRAAYYADHNAIFSVDDVLKAPPSCFKKRYRSFITLNKGNNVFYFIKVISTSDFYFAFLLSLFIVVLSPNHFHAHIRYSLPHPTSAIMYHFTHILFLTHYGYSSVKNAEK